MLNEFSLLACHWKVVDFASVTSGQPMLGPLKLLSIWIGSAGEKQQLHACDNTGEISPVPRLV